MLRTLKALPTLLRVGLAAAVAYRAELFVWLLSTNMPLVMLALWERAPRSLADLGAALHLEPATLSPLVKRLEAGGYVTRARSTEDERRLDVALTPEGAALRERALQVPPQIVERLALPLDELTAVRDTLTRLIGAATHP